MSVQGLDSLLKKLNNLSESANEAVKKGVIKATKKVQGDAKDLAPVREINGGRLRNSIQGTVYEKDNEIIGIVSTNVEYAAYVEFGTGQRGEASDIDSKKEMDISYKEDWAGMAAQPYMYPAMKQNEEYIKDALKGAIRMEIRKEG